MKRILLSVLTILLCGLIAARAMLPQPASAQVVPAGSRSGYNILDLDLPVVRQTAGSGLLAEMNAYYIFRTPTVKNAYTGVLSGMNLIVICADNWEADSFQDGGGVTRMWEEGAHFLEVYRPDWYQGSEGREFSLLSGLMPTNVKNTSSFRWCGQQDIWLPFALPRSFSGMGYVCTAVYQNDEYQDAYKALGFSTLRDGIGITPRTLPQVLKQITKDAPFFLYFVWDDEDGEAMLSCLLEYLDENGLSESTAVCLYTANEQELRGRLFLRGNGLAGAESAVPCSDLDVVPTILNLFGADFDSRFLSGRDIFATNGTGADPSAATPLVSLGGSAYASWVTDGGCYMAEDKKFYPSAVMADKKDADLQGYTQQVRSLVYDRYVFARRIMENNYFHLILS